MSRESRSKSLETEFKDAFNSGESKQNKKLDK
jgi:hypothetical protein